MRVCLSVCLFVCLFSWQLWLLVGACMARDYNFYNIMWKMSSADFGGIRSGGTEKLQYQIDWQKLQYQIDWQHFKHLLIVLSSYFNNCCIGQTKGMRFVPIIIYMSVLSFPGRYYKCPSLMAISPRPPYDKPIHFSALYTVLFYTCYPREAPCIMRLIVSFAFSFWAIG
jgi:hypothetical protein